MALRSCVFGVDHYDCNLSALHLTGHLAPDAGRAEGGVHAVPADGSLQATHRVQIMENMRLQKATSQRAAHLDAKSVSHGDPGGQGDGWDQASKTELQQGETEGLTKLLGGDAGETWETPEGKAAFSGQQTPRREAETTVKPERQLEKQSEK